MTCGLEQKYRDGDCEKCPLANGDMTPSQCVKCQQKHKNS